MEADPATTEQEPDAPDAANEAEVRDAFGLDGDKPPDQEEAGGEQKAETSDDEATTADPDAEKTSEDGAEDGEESQKPLLAGKYRDVDALEKGYGEAATHITKIEAENKVFRDQQAASKTSAPKDSPPETTEADREKALADDPDVRKMREVLESAMGEDDAKAFLKPILKLLKGSSPDNELTQKVESLENEKLDRIFLEQNPDANRPEIQEALATFLKEAAEKGNDPLFQRHVAYMAARGSIIKDLVKQGIKSAVAKMTKAEKELLLAGGIVSGGTTGGSAPGSPKGTTEKEVQEETFYGDVEGRTK